MTFETEFVNLSSKTWVVWESTGPLTVVQPGEKKAVESCGPDTVYAPFSQAELGPDGSLSLTKRSGWIEPATPPGRAKIVLLNIHGRPVEQRDVPGIGRVHLPLSTPVPVAVPAESDLARFAEMRVERVRRWMESKEFPGYAYEVEKIEDVWEPRNEHEVEAPLAPTDAKDKNEPSPASVRIDPASLLETELHNKTSVPVSVLEYRRVLLVLAPGERYSIFSLVPTTSYARYSRITWERDKKISHKVNPKWAPPPSWAGRYLLEIDNEDGADHEGMRVSETSVSIYRGVPRLVPVDISDLNVWYQRIWIHAVTEKPPDPDHPGYLKTVRTIVKEKELRPKQELDEIKQRIEAAALGNAMKSIAIPKDVKEFLK